MNQWKDICKIDDILPETGVCALLGDEQAHWATQHRVDVHAGRWTLSLCADKNILSR